MRLAYYKSPQPYRELFGTTARGHALRDDGLLIHIRAVGIAPLPSPVHASPE